MIQTIAQSESNETQIDGVSACAADVLVHIKTRLEQDPKNKRVWLEEGVLRVERVTPVNSSAGGQ